MKKRIEVLEPNGFIDCGIKREQGDIFTTDRGQFYMDLGWAKCTETGDCGERVEGVSKIKPDPVVRSNGL